jgi:cytochrome c oxidase subunit 4
MAAHTPHHNEGAHHAEHTPMFADGPLEHHEQHGSIFQRIILPFIWLFLLTAAEFFIALVIKTPQNKPVIDVVFIVMTLVKAFFIVAYFMHLKFEFKGLKLSIVLPLMFVVYLIILLIIEAGSLKALLN